MTGPAGAPCAVRIWDHFCLPTVTIVVGIAGMMEIQIRIVPFYFDGIHYPIIIFNFSEYRPLTLHLHHFSKTFGHFYFYWCDGHNKMAWTVGDGIVGMIVNAFSEGVGIHCKFLRLAADVGALIWR